MKQQPNRFAAAELHHALFTAQPFKHSAIDLAATVAHRHGMTAPQLCRDYWTVKQEQERKAARAALIARLELAFFAAVIFSAPFALIALRSYAFTH